MSLKDVICMCSEKNSKGDEDMGIVKNKGKSNHKHHTQRIPHLKAIDGKVEIEPNDPEQVKWFQEFKK